MRILLIRPGAIGDSLLTFPVIQALRTQYSEVHITLVSNPAVLPLAQAYHLADDVFDFGSSFWSQLFLPPDNYSSHFRTLLQQIDEAICWLRDDDGIVEQGLRAAGIKRVIVAPSRPQEGQHIHIADYLLQTIGMQPASLAARPNPVGAGVADEAGWGPLRSPVAGDTATPIQHNVGNGIRSRRQRATQRVPTPPQHHPRPYGNEDASTPFIIRDDDAPIAIHPGSGGAHKCWPVSSFIALIEALLQRALPVLLLGGPADHDRIQGIQHHLRQCGAVTTNNDALFSTLIDAPLLEVAAQVRRCRGYLGNDSGITHLAALLGIPTIALFGPSDPTIWHPIGPHVSILHEADLQHLSSDTVMHALETFILS